MAGGSEEAKEEREVEKKPKGQVDIVGSAQDSWRELFYSSIMNLHCMANKHTNISLKLALTVDLTLMHPRPSCYPRFT